MKKSRAPNFTTAEIMHLLRLVEKYPIIENKKTDGATTKEKQAAWQNLAVDYNSQTSFCPRTADNLQSCYKNQKIKVKKQHSNEKMAIKAPLLLNAVELHGQDWDRVAQVTEESSLDCQNTFEYLVKEAKKDDNLWKKEINRTGGGPPPPPSCSDPIIAKVKSLIGPSLEGLYTIYDGDAAFMEQQQMSASIDTKIQPIEYEKNSPLIKNGCTADQDFNRSSDHKRRKILKQNEHVEEFSPLIENDCTLDHELNKSDHKRLNILKKKIDPSLESVNKGKKKLNVSHSFQELADDKKDLVKVQKSLAEYQIEYQHLLIELAKENLQFTKKKNEIELEFLKQKYDLELDLLRNKKM